jgi:hypothetical protein
MGALGGTGANPSFVATGTIHVSRAVMFSTITGETTVPTSPGIAGVVECTTTGAPVGIAQEGSYYTPGLAGSDATIASIAGYGLHVYGPGETCWGTCYASGLDIPAGAFVKVVTSDGQLGPIVGSAFQSGQWVVGRAIDAIPAGKVGRVYVMPQQLAIPQS